MAGIDEYFVVKTGLVAGTTTIASDSGTIILTSGNITVGATKIDASTGNITIGTTTINGSTGAITTTANIMTTGTFIAGDTNISNINVDFGNAQISGGSITDTPFSNSTVSATRLTTANAQITGGAITTTPISGSTVGATVLTTANAQITGGAISGATLNTSSLTATGGNLDNVVIGSSTRAAGNFTTVNSNGGITGTLQTAAQPNVTSLGTLSSLGVTGGVVAASFSGSGSGLTATSVPNSALQGSGVVTIGSTGIAPGGSSLTLAGLSSVTSTALNGALTGTVGATTRAAGNFTSVDANGGITGTLQTAAQTNITSVGTLTSLTVGSGGLTVTGDLTINGTTTTINASTLDVVDLNITVAKNAASAAAANGAGLTVNGAAATLTYASADDTWNSNKTFKAGTFTGALNGNANSATLATKASTLSQGGSNGTAMTFNYAGQAGQPSYLWGTNDGTNTYVWNPSNFSVNRAASAGYIDNFTSNPNRNDGNDYSLAGRTQGIYAIAGAGANGPGSSYSNLIHCANGTDVAFQIAGGYTADNMYFRGSSALQSGTGYTPWRTVIHSGNIGSQSVSYATQANYLTGHSAGYAYADGGNADTVDGLHVASGVNNVANQIVRTDASGYIQAGYINSGAGNENNNANADRVWGTNGSDNYMRTYRTSALSVSYAATAGSAPANGGTSTYSTYLWSTSHPGSYYISNAWTGTYWQLTSNHGSGVQVAYADNSGTSAACSGNAATSSSCSGNAATVTQNSYSGGGTYEINWRSGGTTYYTPGISITPNTGTINATTFSGTTFSGRATQASYADLAENYTADVEYLPGTVLCFGGEAEVTLSKVDGDRKVAGVVSTAPAYLMNRDLAGTKATVALQGRCPVKVTGKIEKGDMLVSAGNGRARAEAEPKFGQVIGKALENFDGAEGVIEVAIGRV